MFGLNNSNWHGDGIEWIGDAIEAIGYHCGFDEDTVPLTVRNYKVAIPSGIESIDYITYKNGCRLPLGNDESDYGFVNFKRRTTENILTYEERLDLGKEIDNLNALRELDPTTPGVLDQIENTLFLINRILGSKYLAGNYSGWRHDYYMIEKSTQYIKTSFESGIIHVKCRKFMVDFDGLPLIVNTYKYKEAVSWFIISRMILSGRYKSPAIKSWEEAWNMFDGPQGFRLQASVEANMPTLDQMERFKNRWTSLKRDAKHTREIN